MENQDMKKFFKNVFFMKKDERRKILKEKAQNLRISEEKIDEQFNSFVSKFLGDSMINIYFEAQNPESMQKTRTAQSRFRACLTTLEKLNGYRFGDYIFRGTDSEVQLISSAYELQALLSLKKEFYFKRNNRNEPEYGLYPKEFAEAFFKSEYMKHLEEVKSFFKNPVYDGDFLLLNGGFCKKNKIYVVHRGLTPSRSMLLTLELLSGFCWKSESDMVTALGFLLTSVIRGVPTLMGRVPIMAIKGNQPGVGKGELAQCVAVLTQGQTAATMTLGADDVENEKRMGAVAQGGSKLFIFDNVKMLSKMPLNRQNQGEIHSQVIERTATDKKVAFRILGKSKDFSAENTYLIIFTHNDGVFSKDLRKRSVEINLFFNGDPDHREFNHLDIVEFASENRDALLSEFLGMVEVWKDKGRPLPKIKHRMHQWASVVGGILEANGFIGFLENSQRQVDSDSSTNTLFARIVPVLPKECDFTVNQLMEFLVGDPSYAEFIQLGQVTIGKLLSSMVGVEQESGWVMSKKVSQGVSKYKISKIPTK